MKPMVIHDGTNMMKRKINASQLQMDIGVGKKICHGILKNRNVLRCKKLGLINVTQMDVNLTRVIRIVGIDQYVLTSYRVSQLNRALVQTVVGLVILGKSVINATKAVF